MEHKLDLLENAVDSLREALIKFDEGSDTNLSAYKFSILHFSHFFELLFKYYVTQSHPLLIYKNPFSKKIKKENTIGLWEAIQFLKNEGKQITKDFSKDLEWMKKLRNDIEHFKFDMNVIEARRTLGRLIRATDEFIDEHDLLDISSKIGGQHLSIYNELNDEYKSHLNTARIAAKALTEDDGHGCIYCGEYDTAAKIGNKLVCQFCDQEEDLIHCCNCHLEYREDEMRVWNDDPEHHPHIDYICDYCHEYILGKD